MSTIIEHTALGEFLMSLSGVGLSSNFIIGLFALISIYYMKDRVGLTVSLCYLPFMIAAALGVNYLFWEYDVFPGDQGVGRVFTATTIGFMSALLVLVVLNNMREAYLARPVNSEPLSE